MTSALDNSFSFASDEKLYTPTLFMIAIQPQSTHLTPSQEQINETTTSLPLGRNIVLWLRSEGLPISIIAEIMRVERKSIYAWINNGPIRPSNQNRLEKIYTLLSQKKKTKLIYLYRFWHRKLTTGKTLAHLLQQDRLNSTAIQKALAELWPYAIKAKKASNINKLNKNLKSSNPFLDDIGEAIISDDA